MMRHETERLWALVADELDLEDRRYVELHLSDCPECRDALEAVQLARQALESARGAPVAVDWATTDEKVGSLVERRMRAVSRPRWLWAAGGAGLLAAASLVTVLGWPESPASPDTPPPLVEAVEKRPTRVELARGLSRVGASLEPVLAGETLQRGDVLKTGVAGKAFVHLPDESHLRLAGATQVALTRADEDDIALTVSRGRLAVRASHQVRRGFVVHAGDVTVQVVGTIFSVANEPSGVEVAVAEGVVRVAAGDSRSVEVRAGQQLFVDGHTGRTRLGKLTPGLERELAEVQGLAEAVTSAEQQAMVAATGGAARKETGALPRLSAQEARARQVTPLVPESAPPATTPGSRSPAPVRAEGERERRDDPGPVFPSLTGGSTRGVPAPQEDITPLPAPDGPASDESEWVAMPGKALAPIEPSARVEPKAPAAVRPVAKSLEQLFLEKAQASVENGGCERFLVGLEDIALDRTQEAQLARVLRARCYEAQLRPRQAMAEYSKYLEAFPNGRFAEEARVALGQ